MEKFMILLNGEKGLYTSDGRKIFFPDRSNKFKLTQGIALCSVSKEFDKYGFLIGKMVDNVGTFEEALETGEIDINKVARVGKLGDHEYWVISDMVYSIYAFIDGKITEIIFNPSTYNENRNTMSFKMDIFDLSERIDLERIRLEYVDKVIEKTPVIKDRGLIIESIIRRLIYRVPDKILLFDGKVVMFRRFSYDEYFIVTENGLEEIKKPYSSSNYEDLTSEVEQFILEHNLYVSDTPGLVKVDLKCFNSNFTAIFLSTASFTNSTYKGHKEDLDENRKDLEAFKKRVGKFANKSNLSELSKLSTKKLQLGKTY